MTKFSCLLSCFGKEKPEYLRLALRSIQNQTLQAHQVVLVEDGPITVELKKVLTEFEDLLPLKRVVLDENVGLGAALNIGLEECENEIVFRMDTDDVCNKFRFEKQLIFFENNPELDVLGSWANDIDENGLFLKVRKVPESNHDIKKYIWSCPIIHPSVAYKKKSILSIGSYDSNLKRRQDYDLWFRAVRANLNFYNVQEPLIDYRFTDDYYKKNSFKVVFSQFKIALKGLRGVKASPVAYLAIVAPLIRSLLPVKLAKLFQSMFSKFDPRNTKSKM